MRKYEKFSQEELLKIFKTSCTYKEVLEKLGYSNCKQNNIVKECAVKYDLPIEHLVTGRKQKWQYFSEEEIIDIISNSHSYKEALNKLGYTIKDSTMNYKINEIAKLYNISLNHFTKTGTLVGQTFGQLIVLKELEKRSASGKQYLCECQCQAHTIIIVNACDLRSGHTQSCGCVRSFGEFKVSQILSQLQINFKKEYSFEDLVSNKNVKLRFDFYLPDRNILIECQGQQHYENTGGFFDEQAFLELQERDKLKKQYCKKHNIKLIEIPYWDYKNITKEYIQERLMENI